MCQSLNPKKTSAKNAHFVRKLSEPVEIKERKASGTTTLTTIFNTIQLHLLCLFIVQFHFSCSNILFILLTFVIIYFRAGAIQAFFR